MKTLRSQMIQLNQHIKELTENILKEIAQFFLPFVTRYSDIKEKMYQKACLRLYHDQRPLIKEKEYEIDIMKYRYDTRRIKYMKEKVGLVEEDIKKELERSLVNSLLFHNDVTNAIKTYKDIDGNYIAVIHFVKDCNYLIGDNYEDL